MDETFHYLEKADKPCFVSIDKFQVIAKYLEGDFEANKKKMTKDTIQEVYIGFEVRTL